ncbi:sigma-70 family RNA polymerase sigma factor [Streptomyces sp. WAC07061]|uniref:sigma-70 family RNA polymerase sigma factor n=1 Tax=Streptomyces sp. WAC07061 TaxID=2487410 RepID=UPI000F7BAE4B|nr:sigma-70 family RNA polymerase sigma factor [Streptomyces sp. WAC07061]RSS63399.1 sigma-70 family RNA polymerase sigma factor [Streptomyces sp. WAC07061]
MTASPAGGATAAGPASCGDGTRPEDLDPDAEIIGLLLQGDERWLALAHHRWSRLVHAHAARVLGDPREAEDVTQHVFVAAWQGRHGFRPGRGTLPAWLMGIARHKTADALGARTRRLDLVAAAGRHGGDGESAGGVEQVLDRIVVTRELALLPPLQRDVLALAYFADLSQAQIADRTGMPLGTVKSHTRRGLHSLRLRVASGAVETAG